MKEQIEKLLSTLEKEVCERIDLTENNNLPLSVYSLLATDDSVDVRYSLASNANIPSAILYLLTEDENVYVCERARKTLIRLEYEPDKSKYSIMHFGAVLGAYDGSISKA